MEHTFAAAAAAIIITSGLVLCGFALAGEFESGEALSPEESIPVSEEPEEEKLVLGSFEGKLALFRGESRYPNEIYDFLTRTLPPEDRKRLEKGIEVESEEELASLLEDYMS